MTGGQNYIVFWTLRPNLTSRLGANGGSNNATTTAEGSASEKAPESNEAVLTSCEKNPLTETFLCGVSVGKDVSSASSVAVTVTGTAKGAFVVWENFECVRMIPGAHGAYVRLTKEMFFCYQPRMFHRSARCA